MSRGSVPGAANDDTGNRKGANLLPTPATSPIYGHNRSEALPPTASFQLSHAYLTTYLSNIARSTGPLLCVTLTYIYKNLVLFSLPPIYQGYLDSHYHRTSTRRLGERFEYDSNAWNRIVSWTASVCYGTVVCTLCCPSTTLSVAYSAGTGNNTMAVVFGYATAFISIGGLLSAIIIAVFMRLAEAHNRKVTILTASIDDQERAWRVQQIALVLSVPPSSLTWSLIFVVAAMIFFPSETQMHTIHLSAHRNFREGHLLVDSHSANPSLSHPPSNARPSSLPPAARTLVLTVAALVILHLFFILRAITRLINSQSGPMYKADSTDSSQRVRPNSGILGRAQASCNDSGSSSRSTATSESECGHASGDSTESDIGLQLTHLPGSLARRRHRALKPANARSTRRKVNILGSGRGSTH
ncbi:hypothetical protein BC629DRAFT_1461112 [Irpex lacteus]|nr:hypothetical protein BC629DRAFT_1461112 [Irpex lacteus]